MRRKKSRLALLSQPNLSFSSSFSATVTGSNTPSVFLPSCYTITFVMSSYAHKTLYGRASSGWWEDSTFTARKPVADNPSCVQQLSVLLATDQNFDLALPALQLVQLASSGARCTDLSLLWTHETGSIKQKQQLERQTSNWWSSRESDYNMILPFDSLVEQKDPLSCFSWSPNMGFPLFVWLLSLSCLPPSVLGL